MFPKRHAISRSLLFIELADRCLFSESDLHEAYMEAAIIFCRTAIHRLQTKYRKYSGWDEWFESLKGNESIEFIRKERNFILKDASPKVGQIIRAGSTVELAKYCYYYEDRNIPATDTIRRHIEEIKEIVLQGEKLFRSDD